MANTSIGGLVSGLDTASIITQLMQLEARPRTNLQTKVTTNQRAVTALQTFNAKLASIATQAAELAKAGTWGAVKATSDNAKVSVSAAAGTPSASLSFTVNSVATAARNTYGSAQGDAAATVLLTPGAGYQVSYDDGRATETFETGDGTLSGLAEGINKSSGLRATLIRVGTDSDGVTPTYQLQVRSTATGAGSGFSIDPAEPNTDPFVPTTGAPAAGTDASITIEGQSTPFTSATNSIKGLVPGVDVTLAAGAEGAARISVALDEAGVTAKVKGFMDALNATLSEAQSLTKYDAVSKSAGLLAGDAAVRSVSTRLLETVTAGVDGKSLADLGIQSDRTGKLVFDESKFKAAYAADPAGVAQRFTAPADTAGNVSAGLATKVEVLAKSFSNSTDGQISVAIQGRNQLIDRLEDDIANWDVRLETRRTILERQYGALEVALGKLQSQSSWLAGQINSLPSYSSGS